MAYRSTLILGDEEAMCDPPIKLVGKKDNRPFFPEGIEEPGEIERCPIPDVDNDLPPSGFPSDQSILSPIPRREPKPLRFHLRADIV